MPGTPPQKGPGTRHTHPTERDIGPGIPPQTVDRMTDDSENITFPQLRWRVEKIIRLACEASSAQNVITLYLDCCM